VTSSVLTVYQAVFTICRALIQDLKFMTQKEIDEQVNNVHAN